MIKKIIVLAISIFALVLTATAQTGLIGTVTEIIDGRTAAISTGNNKLIVRLSFIEVPEQDQDLSGVVKQHLSDLILGQKVEFRARGLSQSVTNGQLILDGNDIGLQMVRDGAAWHIPRENSVQLEADFTKYAENQDQARKERLGIWGVDGLVPAWEFRAAKALKQQPQTVAAVQQKPTNSAPVTRTAARMPDSFSNLDFGLFEKKNPNAAYENALIGGLEMDYNSQQGIGYVATSMNPLPTQQKSALMMDLRAVWVYRDTPEYGRMSVYLLAVLSESNKFEFEKANSLTVTVGKEKISLGNAYRMHREEGEKRQELLIYRTNAATFKKIAKANAFQAKVGSYTVGDSEKFRSMTEELLGTISE